MGVQGRVAIITGAGQGIGEGIATQLAVGGARVVVNDVVGERVERVAAALAGHGGRALGVAVDVSRA